MNLTSEQLAFIDKVKSGRNVLVEACVGSGKTTAIQHLCKDLPSNLSILYLTYNRLLKVDAKDKIRNKNVYVTNYHGFAYTELYKVGLSAGRSDTIQVYLRNHLAVPHYDVLVLDEYQDIDLEISQMLEYIKSGNPNMQIIAVGDMAQKIYDKTSLQVQVFIDNFLGDYDLLEFTQCFRLSPSLASSLGNIWEKKIIGVNPLCKVEVMSRYNIVDFLASQDVSDVLCLGARTGLLASTLNELETHYRLKYNKHTVYASIRDNESDNASYPTPNCAIFTTFDSCKGLERNICVVFDYTEEYWLMRVRQPAQRYEILRNIFCVAASRGKSRIIFVKGDTPLVTEETLARPVITNHKFKDMDISTMFDFKFKEDVEECYSLLKIKRMKVDDTSVIDIKNRDALIDISPCIGIYQEAVYFDRYNIDNYINFNKEMRRTIRAKYDKHAILDSKILYLTAMETRQLRYVTQVQVPFVSEENRRMLINRLGPVLSKADDVQVRCEISFAAQKGGISEFTAKGFADVVHGDIVYELKFMTEMTHEHFLQCAFYVVALGLSKGILWNTRNNIMYEITIPNKRKFLNTVARTITKGAFDKYYAPK